MAYQYPLADRLRLDALMTERIATTPGFVSVMGTIEQDRLIALAKTLREAATEIDRLKSQADDRRGT